MLHLEVLGQPSRIRFTHRYDKEIGRIVTTCFLERQEKDGKSYILVRKTEAVCSDQDQFNRSKGRKLSLERLLTSISRPGRQRIMAAYWAARAKAGKKQGEF